jgi:hypothetical protein
MYKAKRRKNFFVSLILLISFSASAQTGGQFAITQSVIAGGGQNSAGGAFSVDGTIGQTLAGNTLTGGAFSLASGFWNFNPFAGQGLEADVAPRPHGDGVVQSNDVVQIQRFQIGLDLPFQTNELQRADTAPFSSRGDNRIQSDDTVQAQRYQIGLEALQNAAGPGALAEQSAQNESFSAEQDRAEIFSFERQKSLAEKINASPSTQRRLHVQNAGGSAGQQVTVNILADADGDESAYGFLVTYNQALLTNPTTAIGAAGGSRLCSTATAGQINCSVNNFPNNNPTGTTDQIGEILPGDNQMLLRITFSIPADTPASTTAITLSNVNASNDAAQSLPISAQNGTVTILGTTAASVSVAGRILTAQGRGIRNARLTLTDADGAVRYAQTGAFGYYRFAGVEAGQTYILQISSKRFAFANPTRVLNVQDEISDADFVAENQLRIN